MLFFPCNEDKPNYFFGLRLFWGDSDCPVSASFFRISFRMLCISFLSGTCSKGRPVSFLRGLLDMTLLDLQKLFNTDEKCREALTKMRWPNGVECPRCHGKQVTWIKSRNQFDCAECEYHFSVTAGTIFNDSHLPLTTWFTAA